MALELPPLPYAYDALESAIDEETVHIHHDLHHQAYVNNANNALKDTEWDSKSAEEILRNLNSVAENIRGPIRNNVGGVWNHNMYWEMMGPNGGGEPGGELGEAITSTFESFDNFKTLFNNGGATRFGSGWVWLVMNKAGKLEVVSTPNQDNPMTDGLEPIMVNDVWEHAYYLRYRNRRPEYLGAWWNVVNWDNIAARFAAAKAKVG